MQITLIVTLALHLLSGVFWAGSTFALALSAFAAAFGLLIKALWEKATGR